MSLSAVEQYRDVVKKIEGLREQAVVSGREAFNEGAAAVFGAHPTLVSFSWVQYTPYFNDGGPCNFGASTDWEDLDYVFLTEGGEEEVKGWDLYDYHYETDVDGRMVAGGGRRVPVEGREAFNETAQAVGEFLSPFDLETLEALFGDHVSVTVKRDGTVEVEGYDHE